MWILNAFLVFACLFWAVNRDGKPRWLQIANWFGVGINVLAVVLHFLVAAGRLR